MFSPGIVAGEYIRSGVRAAKRQANSEVPNGDQPAAGYRCFSFRIPKSAFRNRNVLPCGSPLNNLLTTED